MSCIEVTISRASQSFTATASRDGSPAGFSVSAVTRPLTAFAERLDEMHYYPSRVDGPITFRCGLVCSLEAVHYLRVEPQYIWLLPENDFSEDVAVYSDVSWTVDY